MFLLVFTTSGVFAAPSGFTNSVKSLPAYVGTNSGEKVTRENADLVIGKGECKTIEIQTSKGSLDKITKTQGKVTAWLCDSSISKSVSKATSSKDSLGSCNNTTLSFNPKSIDSSLVHTLALRTADHKALYCAGNASMSYFAPSGAGIIVRWYIGSPGGGYLVDVRNYCSSDDGCIGGTDTGVNSPDQADAFDLLYEDIYSGPPRVLDAYCFA